MGWLGWVNGVSLWRRVVSLREQSWLLVGSVAAFLGGYAALAFSLFYFGLRFLSRFPGIGNLLVERLIYLLFAFLFGLLLISNLVVSYTNFFRNRETQFLLTLPVRASQILRWKIAESTVLASWAFLFLVAPLLAAYGLANGAPWHFYPGVVGLVALFIVLPGVIGAWGALHLACRLDRKSFQLVMLFGVIALLLLVWRQFRPGPPLPDDDARVLEVVDRLLRKTRFAEFPLLPSCWLSNSVQFWAEGALPAAGFYAAVLLSYGVFFGAMASRFFGDALRAGASATLSRSGPFERWAWARRWQASRRLKPLRLWERPKDWLDAALGWRGMLRSDVRALVVKDLRVFWRDTTQWGQTAMLFGLLAVYIVNLRHFTRQLDTAFWVSLVSYLNLGACALNVATITTRFVFPQFSLEGQRVWLVGMAPLGLVRVIWLKLWLGNALTLGLTLALTLASSSLLQLGWGRTLFFSFATSIMTFTLNALAVGLGALYPNFRETNPAKIVSGFGGTFCLVASFLYIVGSVTLLALGNPWGWGPEGGSFAAAKASFGWTVFLLASFLTGWLPLRLGLGRVARVEL